MDSIWRRFRCWNATLARFVLLRIIQPFIYSFLAPRVGCLNFHSLLELRRGLQYGSFDFHWKYFILTRLLLCFSGTVLLDLDEQTLEGIYEAIINDAIANGQMNKDVKDEILRLLISDHRYIVSYCFISNLNEISVLDIKKLVIHFDVVHQ